MPRVHRTAYVPVATGYPTLPLAADSADFAMTAADATNKEDVNWATNVVIIARNTGAGARTVTITSSPALGRTGDIAAYSMGAGEVAVFGPFPSNGWRQSDGKIYFEASHAEVLFGCLAVPQL